MKSLSLSILLVLSAVISNNASAAGRVMVLLPQGRPDLAAALPAMPVKRINFYAGSDGDKKPLLVVNTDQGDCTIAESDLAPLRINVYDFALSLSQSNTQVQILIQCLASTTEGTHSHFSTLEIY